MSRTPDSTSTDPQQIIADLRRERDEARAERDEAKAERDEALEQQTATAEVLGVINSSPGELAPVFGAILEKAHALCGIVVGTLQLFDGAGFHTAAQRGITDQWAGWLRQSFKPMPGQPPARLLGGERIVHIIDLGEYAKEQPNDPRAQAAAEQGLKTALYVPLRKDAELLGYISAFRPEVRPFTDKQIALLQNFAAQAVIAMENARLLGELRQRTGALEEALDQQTATSEVLGVINSSPGDLTPVFEAMLDKALALCGAAYGGLSTFDGECFHAVAGRGNPELYAWQRQHPLRPTSGSAARIFGGEDAVQITDIASDEAFYRASPGRRALVDGGVRTLLAIALRKDKTLLGMLVFYRREVRPFSDKQIALLQNFAAQAVIAMENARLLGELRQRTGDLEEALEQQTATAEVLGVINASPGDLTPVFDAILEKAHSLCGASTGSLQLYDGEFIRAVATRGLPDEFADMLRQPRRRGSRLALRHAPFVQIADIADPVLTGGDKALAAAHNIAGVRTVLSVPLLKDDALLGVIVAGRREVRPFTDKQIALLQNFAAQAVIAMENARLITETREALEQQTATAEVLGVINSSPGDLAPVFDAIVEKAMRLCEAAHGYLFTYDGARFHPGAIHGDPRLVEWQRQQGPFQPPAATALGRIMRGERLVQIADLREDDGFRTVPAIRHVAEVSGGRSSLTVALRRDEVLLGAVGVYHQEVRLFTDKQIALLQNFAAQAVIAMENARLLGELQQRTEEVAELNRGLEARVAEQVEELGRVGRLKRFLAPQLAELIVSHGDEKILESHRREIVVVFCDLRGYTAFTETAEPEEVLDFLREYHGALGPLVAEFEGTLDQFSGDGIMVFFNDPVPIPDPAERAVKMAVAMRAAAGDLIAAWRERGRELGFGAGIAQGYATLGQIGFAERSGYTAIGTVCNVAARLCAEAKDGQILLSQRVNVALQGSVTTEQLGALALKGLTQPVVACNVPLAGGQAAFRVIEGGPQSI